MIGMSDDRNDSEVAGLRRRVGMSLRALGSDLDALDEAGDDFAEVLDLAVYVAGDFRYAVGEEPGGFVHAVDAAG